MSLKIDKNITTPQMTSNRSVQNKGNKPIFNFNGEYSEVKQADDQIDCWLLSDLNSMSRTKWGKDAIKQAIKPDGQGGVNITFPGSPINQKTFHISVEELYSAKQSGKYSKGNDNVLAIELATEKLFKYMHSHNICRLDGVKKYNSYLGNMLEDPKTFNSLDISELLTNRKNVSFVPGRNDYTYSEKNNTMLKIATKSNNLSLSCTFGHGESYDKIYPNHSFGVIKMVPSKYVVLSNSITNKNVTIDWEEFVTRCLNVRIAGENKEVLNEIKSSFPKNYNKIASEQVQHMYSEKMRKEKEAEDKINKLYETKNSYNKQINKINEIQKNVKTTYQKLMSIINNESFDKTLAAINKLSNMEKFALLSEYKQDLITALDNKAWGWGNGNKKKQLIMPFLNSVIYTIQDFGIKDIASNYLHNYSSAYDKAYEELDATFYTNEQTIIDSLNVNKGTFTSLISCIDDKKVAIDKKIKTAQEELAELKDSAY